MGESLSLKILPANTKIVEPQRQEQGKNEVRNLRGKIRRGEKLTDDEKVTLNNNGYHYGLNEGVKLTHSHICDVCEEVYSHEHIIKSARMQALYGNTCPPCERKTVREITPLLVGSWESVDLSDYAELTLALARAKEQGQQWFTDLVMKHEPRLDQQQILCHLEINKLAYERLERMKSWKQFIGQSVCGRVGPIEAMIQLDEFNWALKVFGETVYVGIDCGKNKLMDHRHELSSYLVRLDLMEQQRKELENQISEELRDVHDQLVVVMRRLRNYILVRMSLGEGDFLILDHIHYSKRSCYDMVPIEVHRIGNVRVFRSFDGYVMFATGAYIEGDLLKYMDTHPFNHLRWVEFDMSRGMAVDVDELLSQLMANIDLCHRDSIYRQLTTALGEVEYRSNVYYRLLNYLKLAHYYQRLERPSCRVFLFSGEPGVGKSYDVQHIAGVKSNVYYYCYDHKTKQFFDGYKGQSVMVIDDLGHHSSDEWLILLKLVTDIPYMLPMAGEKLKDRIPSLIEEIYITTNCLNKLMKLDKTTRDAICRRIELVNYRSNKIVEMGMYSRVEARFVPYTTMTRAELYTYFGRYVHSMRQEPRVCVTQYNKIWKKASQIIDVIVDVCPELRAIKMVNDLVRDSVDFSIKSVPQKVHQITSVIVELTKRSIDITRLIRILMKPSHNHRDARYAVNELARGNLSELSTDQIDGLRFLAKGGRNGVDTMQAEGGSFPNHDELLKEYTDESERNRNLQPELRSVVAKQAYQAASKYYIPLNNPLCYDVTRHEAVRPIFTCGRWLPVQDLKPFTESIGKDTFVLRNLPDKLKKLYRENQPFSMFAPLSYDIGSVVDESDYKPYSVPWFRVNYSKLNTIIHEFGDSPSSGATRTGKRREERKRAHARSILVQ